MTDAAKCLRITISVMLITLVLGVLAAVVYPIFGNRDEAADVVITAAIPEPLKLSVVKTPKEMAIGLSKRKALGNNEGMLFDYGKPAIRCMWNKDVAFDVAAAFLDINKKSINVAIMPAHSEKPECSIKPARYVIELSPEHFSTGENHE